MPTVTSKDGTQIAYDVEGDGPLVILVDGALCYRDFGPMSELASHLAPHFTVVTYDRRGRGESGDTAPYAVDREIEDVDALISEVGESACLVGISSGGALALRAAANGLRVDKLVLYEPPLASSNVNGSRSPGNEDTIRDLVDADKRSKAVALFMKDVGTPWFVRVVMRIIPGVWSKMTAVAHTLPYDFAVLGATDGDESKSVEMDAVMRSIRVPTLAMVGEKSPPDMESGVQMVADIVPEASMQVLAGQSHDVSPDVLAPAVREFLD